MRKIYYKVFASLLVISISGCKEQSDFSPLITPESNLLSISENSLKSSHKTPAQRKKEADELRVLYSKPQSQWPKAEIEIKEGVEYDEITSLPAVQFPSDNQYSPKRAELGKALFFDKRLSGSNALSCATCHNPAKGWADAKELPTGHLDTPLKRHSPGILNLAYNTTFFWDGRAKSLEDQAVAVLTNPNEMHATPEFIEETFNKIPAYQKKFKEAYGIDRINIEYVTKALATFERTVVTKNQSPFDQFVKGNHNALSDSSIRGLHVFRTQGRCMNCHSGANFTDNKFHNLTLTYEGTEKEDLGRFNVTKDPKDWGKFKTPSLRNITETSPYMHNGIYEKLSKVLSFYNDGTNGKDPHKSVLIKSLSLSDEQLVDLEEFMKSLTESSSIK